MRYLVFSDVHGNLPAFEKMLKNETDIDQLICLGDLVNYGPWSNECVDLLMTLNNCIKIRGNHEDAFIEGNYPGKNQLVKTFFDTTFPLFARRSTIKEFVDEYIISNFVFTHTINNQYIFPDSHIDIDTNYIIGHSHYQFEKIVNGFKIYNPGSVGQNRKYINQISYLVIENDFTQFFFKNLVYEIAPVLNEMKSKNYPQPCIDYYMNKQMI